MHLPDSKKKKNYNNYDYWKLHTQKVMKNCYSISEKNLSKSYGWSKIKVKENAEFYTSARL